MMRTHNNLPKEDYIFFWKTKEHFGFASQWSKHGFTVNIDDHDIYFKSCEQWMMYQKALLFRYMAPGANQKVMDAIMKPGLTQAQIKALGRKVKGFDEKTWKDHRYLIVYRGNLHKFRQNPEIMKKLLATGDKQLVEASPFDRIWGIGYAAKDAMNNVHQWGLNLLGEALMHVRETLQDELDE